ncbi:unnamed protein product [Wuchereria bancrofti]|uniref:Uncharacterized protein n=1 Tax=Wuchereria bancrofti TaxID=6293 RepID=A0A3P7DKU0_WUCBA|nr:unnamed protein product [Wuchereria bancrofti]
MAEKSMEIDLPLAPDVIDICQQEYKRMKRNPDLKPNQNILKTQRQAICKHLNITDMFQKSDKPRPIHSRIQVNEKTEDVPIACDDNPALLMKVPIKYTSDKQQYFSLSDSNK